MRLSRKLIGFATAAVAVIASGGIALGAAVANGTYDPGSSPRDFPNATGLPELQQVPWASPLPAGAVILTKDEAERLVRDAIGAAVDAPTFSELLTGVQAVQKFSLDRNTTTDESRPVWIVTVQSQVSTDGGPAVSPSAKSSYSAVVDAGSAQITDDCIGCAWLTASK